MNCLFKLNEIKFIKQAKKNIVNIINVKFNYKKIFDKISNKSNSYIERSFNKSLEIIKNNIGKVIFINGPISKKTFFKKKFSGVTEYLSKKTKSKNEVMLIYNDKLSVSPLTTHIPIKYVSKKLKKKKLLII